MFPADCLLCSGWLPWRQRGGVCLPCWEAIPWTPGLRLISRGPLRGIVWASDHEGAARRLIHILKFEKMAPLAKPLAQETARRVQTLVDQALPHADLVAPVPLHWSRRLRRGFNQAELLAHGVARALDLPFEPRLLRRPRAGRRQLGLGRRDRRTALQGAFRAARPLRIGPGFRIGATSLQGRTVLLVDDVTTTGATLESCAAALCDAGAAAVIGLVVARAR